MRRFSGSLIVLAAVLWAAAADLRILRPALGDARLAGELSIVYTNQATVGMLTVDLPDSRDYQELTFCAWVRLRSPTGSPLTRYYQTTAAFVCPEPVRRSGPDILTGGCGYGSGGTNLSGAVSFDAELTGYSALPDRFLNGVYTVAGASSNAITVTVGGEDVSLGPGEFNRNVEAGPADSVQVSGSGWCEVGVAKCHLHRFSHFLDGVTTDDMKFTLDSIVTNEIRFVSYRFRIEGGHIVYNSDMAGMDLCDQTEITQSNALAQGVSSFSGRGLYRIGLNGLSLPTGEAAVAVEWFDLRAFGRRLSDAELCRIHGNGVLEISRRGIPRNR